MKNRLEVQEGDTIFYCDYNAKDAYPFRLVETKVAKVYPLLMIAANGYQFTPDMKFYFSKKELFDDVIHHEEEVLAQLKHRYEVKRDYIEKVYAFATQNGVNVDVLL